MPKHTHRYVVHADHVSPVVSIWCEICSEHLSLEYRADRTNESVADMVEDFLANLSNSEVKYSREQLIEELAERRPLMPTITQTPSELTAELATRCMTLTLDHVRLVAEYLSRAQRDLSERAIRHDASKFIEPEFSAYALNQPTFDGVTYGSPEYRAALKAIKPAIQHHYQMNSHHPEHYEDGILGMSLFDVMEMVCDWMAASQRGKGEVHLRLDLLAERFNISEQLLAVIWNTVRLIDPRFEHTAPNVFSIEDTLP